MKPARTVPPSPPPQAFINIPASPDMSPQSEGCTTPRNSEENDDTNASRLESEALLSQESDSSSMFATPLHDRDPFSDTTSSLTAGSPGGRSSASFSSSGTDDFAPSTLCSTVDADVADAELRDACRAELGVPERREEEEAAIDRMIDAALAEAADREGAVQGEYDGDAEESLSSDENEVNVEDRRPRLQAHHLTWPATECRVEANVEGGNVFGDNDSNDGGNSEGLVVKQAPGYQPLSPVARRQSWPGVEGRSSAGLLLSRDVRGGTMSAW